MTFEEYQKLAAKTAKYPAIGAAFVYPTLGLAGEAGEVAEKIKKLFRDSDGTVSQAQKQELMKELGDVLWYLTQLATELGLSLEEVAAANLAKLSSRQERGKLGGSGDNR